MRLRHYAFGWALFLNGCADDAASLAVMGVVALVTGWAISASLRPRDGAENTKSADGKTSLLPRFHTPEWIQESHALLRVFGAEASEAAINEKSIKGLPFPVGYVADVSELVVRFNELRIDGVECSKDELYEIALTNLCALEPSLELPTSGVKAFRDDTGHAAARALLIPELLVLKDESGGETNAVCVVAPSRELLLIFDDGDKGAARKARALFDECVAGDATLEGAPQDRPIPKPVRVTARGFTKARWPK